MADIIAQLRALLGYFVLLLPIPRGEKGPRVCGWQKLTIAAMDDPVHLARFRLDGNIGVSLGEPSNGLCTIDLDSMDAAELFLRLNPNLAGTLRTTRVRGCNLWLRIVGSYPPSSKLKDYATKGAIGEWRASGNQTVIHGAAMDTNKGETQLIAYRRLVDAPPVEIAFNKIVWPENWGLPWATGTDTPSFSEQELTEQQGGAFAVSERGRVTLNPPWFVARFAAEHDVLFDRDEARFYTYQKETGLWRTETEAALRIQFANDLKRYADGQDAGVSEQIINARNNKFLAGLVALLQGLVERRETFRRTPKIVHVANGMLHLDSDLPQLRLFAPDYFSRNAAPVAFDPNADCTRFRHELLESALDADDVSLIQRYAGSLLLGQNLAQKILMLTGTAGSGKSTLLEIIERVIGLENVGQIRTDLLAERFEVARFIGRTLLTGKDVAGRFLDSAGAHVLKALVGHDLLDAERKGSNASFQVRGDFGVVITCNSRLRVRLDGDAEAWQRRLLIVKYDRPRPERPERDFAAKLLASEGPGILRWMVDGAQAHLAEVERCGDFVLTARQRQRVDALLAESDSVREFIRRRVEKCTGAEVSVFELVEAYTAFCEEMGWEPLSARRVENTLADAMQELCRVARRNDVVREGNSKKGFKGVRIIKAGEAAAV